jgi:hypothetical protein
VRRPFLSKKKKRNPGLNLDPGSTNSSRISPLNDKHGSGVKKFRLTLDFIVSLIFGTVCIVFNEGALKYSISRILFVF